jgi:hypothetical protein
VIKTEQWNILFKDLELGLSVSDSCEDSGMDRSNLYRRMDKDAVIKKKVEKAILSSKKRCVGLVQQAAINQWQAAAWWLERKHKEEFSIRQEHTGPEGKDLVFEVVIDQGNPKITRTTSETTNNSGLSG